MTTFAPLSTASATLSATTVIDYSNNGSATLRAAAGHYAGSSVSVGGVIQRNGRATLGAVSTQLANGGALRVGAVTLSAVFAKPVLQGGTAEFLPLSSLASNKPYAAGTAIIGPLTSTATDPLPIPSFAIGAANIEPMVSQAYVLTGEVGSATVNLALASLSANRPYAGSRIGGAELGISLWSYALDGEGNLSYSAPQYVYGYGWFDTHIETSKIFMSSVDVTADITPERITDAALIDLLLATEVTGTSLVVSGSLLDVLTVIGAVGRRDPMSVWAVNATNKATSKYENFEFNSFAEYKGRYFIANDSGVFELGGDTDAGADIVASVMVGKQDFSTSAKKRVYAVYTGTDAATELELTVFTDDGQRNSYTIDPTSGLQSVRTLVGRGLYSRYWQFMVTNPDGGMFEIESMEVLPDVATRRI